MADSTETYPGLGTVLVIVPTYNEGENLEWITGRLRKAVPGAHILVVDDNSPDGTGQIADRLAQADDHVHVLHRQGKEGLSAAYLAGFRWGLDRNFDVLVEHDADGSHQPEQLHRLLDALASGADMVKGSRWIKGGSVVNWSKSRELLSRAGSLWTRWMLGMPIKDVTGGLNAFKAATLREIIDEVGTKGFGIQRDLTWYTHQHGMKVVEVPIDFKERERGNSKMTRDVFVEALKQTTVMGINYRAGQVKALLGNTSKKG